MHKKEYKKPEVVALSADLTNANPGNPSKQKSGKENSGADGMGVS